jgi:hypothetical protein
MKFNTILISLFFILFQSCYSYKKIDFKSNETLHHEQIKIKLKNSKKREFSWSKTTILSITYSFGLILFITVTTILTPFL